MAGCAPLLFLNCGVWIKANVHQIGSEKDMLGKNLKLTLDKNAKVWYNKSINGQREFLTKNLAKNKINTPRP